LGLVFCRPVIGDERDTTLRQQAGSLRPLGTT